MFKNLSLRSIIFWSINRSIRKNYFDVKNILGYKSNNKISNSENKYLEALLEHAVKTTHFYKKLSGFKKIEEFPVIDKSIVRDNYNMFFSSIYDRKALKKITTSGSTGAPLTVYQDKRKRIRHNAENIYYWNIAGHVLGAKLYYLRVWNEINRKRLFDRIVQNIVMVDFKELSDQRIYMFLSEIEKDKSRKSILAFASTLEAIANFILRNYIPKDYNVKIDSIISISETLSGEARIILEKSFGCPVVSRYSNMENGFIAQQCGHNSGEYHINKASFYVELLSLKNNMRANKGEYGRIVVTDLFNYSMPLIRYDTGDVAKLSLESSCGDPGPVFTNIHGRKVDFIFDTKDNMISPHAITNTMWKYANEVKQFQFIQESRISYTIKLNCIDKNSFNYDQLLNDLRIMVGTDAELAVEVVEEIPVLASGKRKKIVNKYKTV